MLKRNCHRALPAVAFLIALTACSYLDFSDAATRVATDIQAGADTLRHSSGKTLIVDHTPKTAPDGCPGGYTLQLIKDSLIGVWCQETLHGPSVSSHVTTFHLNFVTVPKTWIVHKDHGQHTLIELTRQGDAIVVTDVR